MNWKVIRVRGDAASLHARVVEPGSGREVWIMEVTRPALVLGSTQSDADVDPDRAGELDIVRRASGGGAVLLRPDAQVWIDVILPPHDPLWVDDIGQSFLWLGETWQRALSSLGVSADVHRARPERDGIAALACFAGTGWGEVVGSSGKLVGLAQRRTRAGARFQTTCYVADPGPLPLRGLTPEGERAARPALVPAPPARVADAFLAALPAAG